MFAKTSLVSLSALAAVVFAGSSHASPTGRVSSDPDATSVSVSIADLNLSTPAGAKIALQRIHNAADTICGGEPDVRLMQRRALYQSCVKTTVDQAVASLDSPIVTALNAGGAGSLMVANGR